MKFEGRFTDGSPKGPGKITFPDGTSGNPKQEGYFQGTQLLKRTDVPEEIIKAQHSAQKAKKLVADFIKAT